MAVSTMQAVSIIGLTRDIDNVISVLGESGVFHPDDVSSFYSNTKDFTHLQSKNIYAEPLNTLKATLSLTKRKFNLVDVSDFNPTFKEIELFTNQINSDIEVLADDRLFVDKSLVIVKGRELSPVVHKFLNYCKQCRALQSEGQNEDIF